MSRIQPLPPPIDHVHCQHYHLATIQYHNNNSLLADDETSPYNPAFDIHLTMPDHRQISHLRHALAKYATSPFDLAFDIHLNMPDHRQISHQHHSITAKYATSTFDPAFDIHLTDHGQKRHHQHHTRLQLAPTVPVFAQNKRPP